MTAQASWNISPALMEETFPEFGRKIFVNIVLAISCCHKASFQRTEADLLSDLLICRSGLCVTGMFGMNPTHWLLELCTTNQLYGSICLLTHFLPQASGRTILSYAKLWLNSYGFVEEKKQLLYFFLWKKFRALSLKKKKKGQISLWWDICRVRGETTVDWGFIMILVLSHNPKNRELFIYFFLVTFLGTQKEKKSDTMLSVTAE